MVYACHVLEHIPRPDTADTLAEWRRVLKPGGVLRVAVPAFSALVELYQETGRLSLVLGPLYGRQDYPENTHYQAFDWYTLRQALFRAGFRDIHGWDWRQTDHADHDDGSQHYYPHMQKAKGLHLSLNLEAVK
jgi:predicted SAM-dependent methyltransferase